MSGNGYFAVQQFHARPFRQRIHTDAFGAGSIEKEVPGPPGILRGVGADIGRNTVHLDVGDGLLRLFVAEGNPVGFHAVLLQELGNPVFLPVVLGITSLEFVDECIHVLPRPEKDEMNMVGHQDEGQNGKCRHRGGQNRHIIHPNLEIRFLPKPQAVLQMIRGDKPDTLLFPHTPFVKATVLCLRKDNGRADNIQIYFQVFYGRFRSLFRFFSAPALPERTG